jgi:predicted metal-dependent enzyme (double-stranded beta helix superfamily)
LSLKGGAWGEILQLTKLCPAAQRCEGAVSPARRRCRLNKTINKKLSRYDFQFEAIGIYLYPHDHRMWAVIGVYGGQEENAFYRRGEGRLMEHGNKTLRTKDTLPLGESIIHAVTNPLERITAAIHVYGGDFFAVPRSEWDPQTLEERAFDLEHAAGLRGVQPAPSCQAR